MNKRKKFFVSIGEILGSKKYWRGRFFGGVRRGNLLLDKHCFVLYYVTNEGKVYLR